MDTETWRDLTKDFQNLWRKAGEEPFDLKWHSPELNLRISPEELIIGQINLRIRKADNKERFTIIPGAVTVPDHSTDTAVRFQDLSTRAGSELPAEKLKTLWVGYCDPFTVKSPAARWYALLWHEFNDLPVPWSSPVDFLRGPLEKSFILSKQILELIGAQSVETFSDAVSPFTGSTGNDTTAGDPRLLQAKTDGKLPDGIATERYRRTYGRTEKALEKIDLAAIVDAIANTEKEVEPNDCHVTLLQMAAMVNRTKRTLERLRDGGILPPPAVKGGKGKPDEWLWSDARPVLEKSTVGSCPRCSRVTVFYVDDHRQNHRQTTDTPA